MYALAPLRVIESSQVETLWRLNVFSHLWLAKGYRQNRVNNAGGSIVLISSAVGLIGQAGLAAYSASKGAVISLMRSIAIEVARENIRVNCIAPGNLKTTMTDTIGAPHSHELLAAIEKEHPLGFGDPDDVAYAAAYLLSPAAKWITGTTLVVDGGYTAH
jgi:NAD(P)-dependent dehydrogenase (short-subunit alcohol dehydrogenase family)